MQKKISYLSRLKQKFPRLYKVKFTILIPIIFLVIWLVLLANAKIDVLRGLPTREYNCGYMAIFCINTTPGGYTLAGFELITIMIAAFSPLLQLFTQILRLPAWTIGANANPYFVYAFIVPLGLASWGAVIDLLVFIIGKLRPPKKA